MVKRQEVAKDPENNLQSCPGSRSEWPGQSLITKREKYTGNKKATKDVQKAGSCKQIRK